MKPRPFPPLTLLAALLLLLGLAGCERNLRPPRAAANDFFQAIGESRFQPAYDSTAFAFQAKINFDNFRAAARDLALADSTISYHWIKEEKPEDGVVKLTGDIGGANGKPFTVIVTLVKERGAWCVFSLHDTANPDHKERDRFSLVGRKPELTKATAPTGAEAQKLARESVLLFNNAVAHKNFGDFYSQVSAVWQKQLTVGQLKRSFQPFIDANVNLDEVANLDAVFELPPEVDSQGILQAKGHYDTKPQRTNFALRYVYEFPYWRLFGISIELTDYEGK